MPATSQNFGTPEQRRAMISQLYGLEPERARMGARPWEVPPLGAAKSQEKPRALARVLCRQRGPTLLNDSHEIPGRGI
jgi:hypothetical protein